jgi:hypothetical protein
MAVDSRHPDYADHVAEWTMMRDFERGPQRVVERGEQYLSKPPGFSIQTDGGRAMYAAYQSRARVPHILAPTLGGMVGLIHRKDWQIDGLEDGKPLAGMWDRATKDGLTLEAFARRVTTELLLMGRYAAFPDLPTAEEGGGDVPWLAGYAAEALINWDEVRRALFVLDESRYELDSDGFSWTMRRRYRVMRLDEQGRYVQELFKEDSGLSTPVPEGEDEAPVMPETTVAPTKSGGGEMDAIPIVVAGPRDLSLAPVEPPLVGVARAALAAYQLDADYRMQLFMTGQETLVVSGVNKEDVPTVFGPTVVVVLPAESGKAYFVGPAGTGIEQHRMAIAEAKADAVAAGAALFDQTDVPAESGKAKELRYTAESATLTTIAQTSAAFLEALLRRAAVFVGQDPTEIVVTPDLDFVDVAMSPQEALQLVQVWQSGAISYETLYENLQRGRIASAERTADEEQQQVDSESPDGPVPGGAPGAAPAPGAAGTPSDGTGETPPMTDAQLAQTFDPALIAGG